MAIVYLNGEFLPLEDARISVLDRGFIFGDGVYEVLPVYRRQIFRLNEHLNRLDNSLTSIHMLNPLTLEQWRVVLMTLVERCPEDNQSMCKPLIKCDYSNGIRAVTCEDIRWKWCHIKAITLLPSVLLRYEAAEKDATEAILLKDDFVTEGAASNVFIVQQGVVKTPPKDDNILPGITRDLVIELLIGTGIPCREIKISRKELVSADEIWITSSTWEIVPVIELDGKTIGNGRPGKMWGKAMDIYQEFKKNMTVSN
ncbi:MAG: D-amino acid aminotransferase [Gammaproteobacteria bacterium]|nr:D-amino acid aminotransferase [Gammaproteobacteria bacterium]